MENSLIVRTKKQILGNIFGAINGVTEETSIKATPEGLHIRASDPSHYTMLDIAFDKADFDSFECPSELRFGVRTPEIVKGIKNLGKKADDPITMSITQESTIKLESGDRVFEFKLIEAKATDQPLPKFPFTGTVTIPNSYFKEILDAIAVVSKDTVRLDGNHENNLVKFSGKDMVFGEFSETIRNQPEGLPPAMVETKKTCHGSYNHEFISAVARAVSEEMVTINMTNGLPLLLQFGRISYYVAPRVQDD